MNSYIYFEHFLGYWTTVQCRSRGRCCKTSVAFAHTLRARKSSQWQICPKIHSTSRCGNYSREETIQGQTIRGNTVCQEYITGFYNFWMKFGQNRLVCRLSKGCTIAQQDIHTYYIPMYYVFMYKTLIF